MIFERLAWVVFEFLGIGCAGTIRESLSAMLMTKYIVGFEEPLIGILYWLGWRGRKPISMIELEDMFELRHLCSSVASIASGVPLRRAECLRSNENFLMNEGR
jgi:hypothetical protein